MAALLFMSVSRTNWAVQGGTIQPGMYSLVQGSQRVLIVISSV